MNEYDNTALHAITIIGFLSLVGLASNADSLVGAFICIIIGMAVVEAVNRNTVRKEIKKKQHNK